MSWRLADNSVRDELTFNEMLFFSGNIVSLGNGLSSLACFLGSSVVVSLVFGPSWIRKAGGLLGA